MQHTTIYVVRHGLSVHNKAGLVTGHTDTPLAEEGREQARATKAALSRLKFDSVYSSDLQRAAETAAIIAGEPVPEDHQLAGLRERDFAELEEKPAADFDRAHARMTSLPAAEQRHFRYAPNAETDHEVAGRFLGALRDIGRQNGGKTVLVAAHGGTLRILLVELGYATMAELPPGSVANAASIELSYSDGRLQVKSTVGVQKRSV